MMKNNSKNKAYYSQRNNKIAPTAACNVTAMVQALVTAGWPLPKGKDEQPEDNLMAFIRNDDAILQEWKRIDPFGKYPPNQWHSLLCLGTNRWLIAGGITGKKIPVFREDVSLDEYKRIIDKGGAAVFSGRFKTAKGTIGHIVCGVGYFGLEPYGEITHIVIDDPWGDYHSLYRTQKGDNIHMPKPDFTDLLRPLGSAKKIAHLIPKFERRKI